MAHKIHTMLAIIFGASVISQAAHAEPKTITLDRCVKVELEIRNDDNRNTITAKCIGEAKDPEVRNPNVITLPGSSCMRNDGTVSPC